MLNKYSFKNIQIYNLKRKYKNIFNNIHILLVCTFELEFEQQQKKLLKRFDIKNGKAGYIALLKGIHKLRKVRTIPNKFGKFIKKYLKVFTRKYFKIFFTILQICVHVTNKEFTKKDDT